MRAPAGSGEWVFRCPLSFSAGLNFSIMLEKSIFKVFKVFCFRENVQKKCHYLELFPEL